MNTMSALTTAGVSIEFPANQIAPSGASSPLRELVIRNVSLEVTLAAGRRLMFNRVLRLEVLMAAAVISCGCFFERTLTWESALRQTAVHQNQSLARLADELSRQDMKIADAKLAGDSATQDLALKINALTIQLKAQQKKMAQIDFRLRHVETAQSVD